MEQQDKKVIPPYGKGLQEHASCTMILDMVGQNESRGLVDPNAGKEAADRLHSKLEEIRRMAAGGTTSKDVIARMYELTPEQLEEILK